MYAIARVFDYVKNEVKGEVTKASFEKKLIALLNDVEREKRKKDKEKISNSNSQALYFSYAGRGSCLTNSEDYIETEIKEDLNDFKDTPFEELKREWQYRKGLIYLIDSYKAEQDCRYESKNDAVIKLNNDFYEKCIKYLK